MPDDFALTEAMRDYATAHGVSEPEREFEHFVNSHTAKGSRFASWPAAWRTWVNNHEKFNGMSRASPTALPRSSSEVNQHNIRQFMARAKVTA